MVYIKYVHLWTLPIKMHSLEEMYKFFFLYMGSKSSNIVSNSLEIWYYVSEKHTEWYRVICEMRHQCHQSYANNYSSSAGWVFSVNAVHSPLEGLSRCVFSGWCKDVAELGREKWRLNSRWKKTEVVRWLFSFFCGSFWWSV